MKRYAFFAHFNRIAMQQGKENCWTIHFRGACIPAAELVFNVPVKTRFLPHGRQPRATLRGRASEIICTGNRVEVV